MGMTTDLSCDLYKIRSLTKQDQNQLQTLIIDFFAAAFAGYRQNGEFNERVKKVVCAQGGAEESTVLFQSRRAPARTAAFLNAVYGHGAELDDGNKNAGGHAGVHLIPAVFALAEKLNGVTGDDVLRALAVGYETYIRISSAAQPGLIARGFHSTGVAGTLACAAACAALYHLNATGIENAIALATTMTGGLLSYGDSRPAIKPLNPGKAAENGVFAAMLAHEGVEGPLQALEGKNGWFHAVTSEIHPEFLRASDHLLLHDCYFKLYPACRHTHCGIDAAVKLHKMVQPDEIEQILVYVYPNAIRLAGIPFPKDQDETKFSIPYTLACALQNGNYGIADMDPSYLSDKILTLMKKVTMIPDEAMENRAERIRGARVALILKDGRRLEETVLVPRGDPENPLTRDDIIEKLHVCAKGLAGEEALDALVQSIEQIEGAAPFINPMKLLSL